MIQLVNYFLNVPTEREKKYSLTKNESLSFTCPHVLPNMYDFSFAEHKRRYFIS